MNATRPEALDLMRKFLSEGTLLECRFGFLSLAGRLRLRLTRIDGDSFFLRSEGGDEFAFSLVRDMDFAFGDASLERFEGTIVFVFRLREEGESSDFISLTEVIS